MNSMLLYVIEIPRREKKREGAASKVQQLSIKKTKSVRKKHV